MAKDLYEDEVAQAKEFVELLPPGRHDAIGGYSVWGGGAAVVSEVGFSGSRRTPPRTPS